MKDEALLGAFEAWQLRPARPELARQRWPALASQRTGDAVPGPNLPGVSTTLTLTPLDDRGREILNRFEAGATTPFRYSDRTGARSYWINADGVPADGYEAELDRLAPDWREHVNATR